MDKILGIISEILSGNAKKSAVDEAIRAATKLGEQLVAQELMGEAAFMKDLKTKLLEARSIMAKNQEKSQTLKSYGDFTEELERRKKLNQSKSDVMTEWIQQEMEEKELERKLDHLTEIMEETLSNFDTNQFYKIKSGLAVATEKEAVGSTALREIRDKLDKVEVLVTDRERAIQNQSHLMNQNLIRQKELDQQVLDMEAGIASGEGALDADIIRLQKLLEEDPCLNHIFQFTTVQKVLKAKAGGPTEAAKRRKMAADKKLIKMKAAARKADLLAKELAKRGVLKAAEAKRMQDMSAKVEERSNQGRDKIAAVAKKAKADTRAAFAEKAMDIL